MQNELNSKGLEATCGCKAAGRSREARENHAMANAITTLPMSSVSAWDASVADLEQTCLGFLLLSAWYMARLHHLDCNDIASAPSVTALC